MFTGIKAEKLTLDQLVDKINIKNKRYKAKDIKITVSINSGTYSKDYMTIVIKVELNGENENKVYNFYEITGQRVLSDSTTKISIEGHECIKVVNMLNNILTKDKYNDMVRKITLCINTEIKYSDSFNRRMAM